MPLISINTPSIKPSGCFTPASPNSPRKIMLAAGGNLLAIKPFDIIVVFVDDENEIITDVVKVKFQEQGRTLDADSGDDIVKEFDMFCLDIQFNITG